MKQNKVKNWMKVAGQSCPKEFAFPSKEVCDLRISLIQEELNELAEAIANKDEVGVYDALADLYYVLNGAAVAFGIPTHKMNAIFNEVHESNMSKFCTTEQEAIDSCKAYAIKGVSTYTNKVGKYWVIYRSGDHKVLKSINYKQPNLEQYAAKGSEDN